MVSRGTTIYKGAYVSFSGLTSSGHKYLCSLSLLCMSLFSLSIVLKFARENSCLQTGWVTDGPHIRVDKIRANVSNFVDHINQGASSTWPGLQLTLM